MADDGDDGDDDSDTTDNGDTTDAGIGQELFVATLDANTTPLCQSLDGGVYDVDDGPQPLLHYNCRSIRVPYIDGGAIGDRPATTATMKSLDGLTGNARRKAAAEMTGRVPARTTYQTWLQGQSKDFQDEVLGPTRGDLFRSGVKLTQFVDSAGDQLTLDELNGVTPLTTAPLTNIQMENLTLAQVQQLTDTQIAGLSASQISNLDSDVADAIRQRKANKKGGTE